MSALFLLESKQKCQEEQCQAKFQSKAENQQLNERVFPRIYRTRT